MRESHGESDGEFEILPALTPEQQSQMQKQYHEKLLTFYTKNSKYEIDYWYPAIAPYTYPSFSFPLTVTEAYILHCLYYEYKLTEEIEEIMKKLISKIDLLLNAYRNQRNQGKYFMKLSTRSPKDYCWDYREKGEYDRAVAALGKFLEAEGIGKDISSEKLSNALYRFFLVNSHNKLQVTQGKDFIRIFSKSERIITDLNDYSYLAGGLFQKLKEGTLPPEDQSKNLINVWVREWDNCQWQQEFRTFYNNYQLTAISQYDQRCYFPGMAQKKDKIAAACLEIFQKIRPGLEKIGLEKGVLDVVIKPEGTTVVEINVFDRDARASLFNWTTDQKVLLNGPLEIRVLEKEVEISKAHLGSIMGMIDKKSLNVITDALDQAGLLSLWK